MTTERPAIVLLFAFAAACGDDDATGTSGTATGTASGTTSASTGGASGCEPAVFPGTPAPCPDECPAQVFSSAYTLCTVPCDSATAECPSGTECLPTVVGTYNYCAPPCDGEVCPEHMQCMQGRCYPN